MDVLETDIKVSDVIPRKRPGGSVEVGKAR
jgi:hypothetical protein